MGCCKKRGWYFILTIPKMLKRSSKNLLKVIQGTLKISLLFLYWQQKAKVRVESFQNFYEDFQRT